MKKTVQQQIGDVGIEVQSAEWRLRRISKRGLRPQGESGVSLIRADKVGGE